MDKFKRSQLQSLLTDERFRAVEAFLKILKDKYKNDQVKADTEWETLWRVAQREAKIEAIDNILLGLVEEASKDA